MPQFIPFLTVFSLGTMVGLMVYVIVKNYRSWMGLACLGMCLTFMLWTLGLYNAMTLATEAGRVRWYQLSAYGWCFYPGASLLFVQELSGMATPKRRWLTCVITGTAGLFFSSLVMIFPSQFVGGFVFTRWGWGMSKPGDSIMHIAAVTYILISGIVTIFYLAQWSRRTKYRQEKKIANLLIVTGVLLLTTSSFTDYIMPVYFVPIVPLIPILSFPWFCSLCYSAYKYKLFDTTPNASATEVMLRVRDMMLLLDREGVVQQMNASARTVLGYGISDSKTIQIDRILPMIKLEDCKSEVECDAYMLNKEGVSIPVQLSISTRFNAEGDRTGYIVSAYDMRTRLTLELEGVERRMADSNFDEFLGMYVRVLEHAKLGFFRIDSRQMIMPGYSLLAGISFELSHNIGKDFADTVLKSWKDDEKMYVRTVLSNVFEESRPFRRENLVQLLPVKYEDGKNVHSLSYLYLGNDDAKGLKSLLVISENTTEERDLETRLSRENANLTMVTSVMLNMDEFQELVGEYRSWASTFSGLSAPTLDDPLIWLRDAYRVVHTFKGNFLRFGLRDAAAKLMEFESYLDAMLKNSSAQSESISSIFCWEPELWLGEDFEILKEIIGPSILAPSAKVEIEKSVLEQTFLDIEVMARSYGMTSGMVKTLLSRIKELYCISAKKLLNEHAIYVKKVCRERGLPEPDFVVHGSDVLLDGAVYRHLFCTLIHVFHNIVVHGIETAEERLAANKPFRARIECYLELRNSSLRMEIADDGRGIDVESLRKGAIKNNDGEVEGTIEQIFESPNEDIIALQRVFSLGYSTASSVETLAGRGIGLFAVSHAVRQLRGNVKVQSRKGLYTRFIFLLQADVGSKREHAFEKIQSGEHELQAVQKQGSFK